MAIRQFCLQRCSLLLLHLGQINDDDDDELIAISVIIIIMNNNNTFVERHSAVASEALAEQVS